VPPAPGPFYVTTRIAVSLDRHNAPWADGQNPKMKKAKRKKITPRSPTFIDVYIGAHIRKHRLALHLTQRQLAKKLGVTMQQLQKYETGDNRVSAARLYEICKTLNVGIASMFERPKK
jgi:DNA-binding XRE family transcriptional regulator